MRAPLHAAGQQWHVSVERGRLVYQDDRGLMDLAAPKLFGRHQFDNAGLAIATLRALDAFKIGMPRISRPASSTPNGRRGCSGWSRARWSSRRPQGCEIWLDGGHNAEGGRVAAAALGDLEERVSRPLVVIAGMMANKDAGAFLANFAGLTRHIMAVPIPGQRRMRSMPPDRLADAARALGMRVENAASVEAALQTLSSLAYEVPPRILITGSLYLAGHVLAAKWHAACMRWIGAVTAMPRIANDRCALLRLPMCTEIISRWKPSSPTSARRASTRSSISATWRAARSMRGARWTR